MCCKSAAVVIFVVEAGNLTDGVDVGGDIAGTPDRAVLGVARVFNPAFHGLFWGSAFYASVQRPRYLAPKNPTMVQIHFGLAVDRPLSFWS